MSTSIHVITLAEAHPKHVEEVYQLLRELANLHRQEEGCLRFDVYADRKHPTKLSTVEVWESEAAHQAHLDSPLLLKSVLKFFGKVRSVPEVRVLSPVSEMEP